MIVLPSSKENPQLPPSVQIFFQCYLGPMPGAKFIRAFNRNRPHHRIAVSYEAGNSSLSEVKAPWPQLI
jgi:hypothetical protein